MMTLLGSRARRIALSVLLGAGLWAAPSQAVAEEEPTPPPGSEPSPPPSSEPSPPGAEPSPPGTEPSPPGTEPAPAEKAKLGTISWRDIVVVPRRPILKYHRVEIIPTYMVAFNNSLIRHHGLGAVINFF